MCGPESILGGKQKGRVQHNQWGKWGKLIGQCFPRTTATSQSTGDGNWLKLTLEPSGFFLAVSIVSKCFTSANSLKNNVKESVWGKYSAMENTVHLGGGRWRWWHRLLRRRPNQTSCPEHLQQRLWLYDAKDIYEPSNTRTQLLHVLNKLSSKKLAMHTSPVILL